MRTRSQYRVTWEAGQERSVASFTIPGPNCNRDTRIREYGFKEMFSPKPPVLDHRPAVTRTIWRSALGMLFLAIPLVPLTHFSWLPVCVIGGAALGTWGVWMFGGREKPVKPAKDPAIVELEGKVAALSERLENVEILNRFEERLVMKTVGRSSVEQPLVAPAREFAGTATPRS